MPQPAVIAAQYLDQILDIEARGFAIWTLLEPSGMTRAIRGLYKLFAAGSAPQCEARLALAGARCQKPHRHAPQRAAKSARSSAVAVAVNTLR